MPMDREEFRTFRGYTLAIREQQGLTPSMEDYLEMIYRLSRAEGFTRVNDLARTLNVKPPSVSNMIQRLYERELIRYEKYGVIHLTKIGGELGSFLLKRHLMLEQFLQYIGVEKNLLENVERIEHNLTSEATQCLFLLVEYIEENPRWFQPFQRFLREKLIKENLETP